MILNKQNLIRFICCLLCLLPVFTSMAQVNDAPTVITLKKRSLHIRLSHQQIKITTENQVIIKHGTQRANLSALERIGYSKFNKLLSVQAFTITPKGDTLHVTRFSDQSAVQSGIFYDDYMERVFLFPGVISGAVSHLYYTEELSEPRFLGVYYFNSALPVLQSEFEIHCDRHIRLDFSAFNTENVSFRQKKQRKGWLYAWSATRLPVFRKKEGEQDISYRAPHIIPRISYYQLSERVKIPLLSGIADLYGWYGGLLAEADEEPQEKNLQQMSDSLTAGLLTPEAKARAIFRWVQQNIQYIAFEDGYGGLIPRKASEVLRKRYGDCKDMTALLVALMRRAGIDAYFTWIGTRRLPYRYTELPTPMVDNHMIATIQTGNRLIFLDATDPDIPFGNPSAMIQGKEALIGKSRYMYDIQTVPPVDAGRNILQDSAVVTLLPDTIRVSGMLSGSGYFKGELQHKNPLFTDRNLISTLWQMKPTASDSAKTFDYAYRLHHAVIRQGKQIYFNPHTATVRYQEKWLPPQTPFNHWELEYAFTLIQKQFVRLPTGWEITMLPDNVTAQYPDFGFTIRYEKKPEGIDITRTIFVNTLSIGANRLADWQRFIETYNHSVRQNIILYPGN